MKIHFLTATYNRPEGLKILLDSIAQQHYDVHMTLIDDGSKNNVKKLTKNYDFPIELIQHEKNWGKSYYWKTLTQLYKSTKNSDADYFINIADDMFLLPNTIDEAIYYWERIMDNKKISLTLYPQRFPKKKDSFSCHFGNKIIVINCNFIDHIFLCTKNYFKFLNYECPKVSMRRWHSSTPKSSGTSMVLGKYLKGFGMYMTPRNLIGKHKCSKKSKMNGI